MSQNSSQEQWSEVITPKKSWFDLKLGELWQYRDLIILFVRRDFVATTKQTVLGPLWHFIPVVVSTLIFTIVFSGVAKIPTNNQPPFLFYLCGTTIWSFFASCLSGTANTFTSNANIFGKVYFPRLAIPFSIIISNLIRFGIQMMLFLVFYAFYIYQGKYSIVANKMLLLLPVFLLIMAFLGLGLGIIISSLTTKYRDLSNFVGFGVQLLMYATPVIYPSSILSPQFQFYMKFNPIAPIVEGFRHAFMGNGNFQLSQLLFSIVTTIVIFTIGLLLFRRVEKTFMDTV
ncbi:MAG TPA: ABC transporter permease [Microscillaceae bacterium]|nr:ABC transporter permease [Microscillaceae bacterium]